MRRALMTLCLAALLPSLAVAQSSGGSATPPKGDGHMMRDRFVKADTNGDGKLSKSEAQAGMPMVYRNFDAIDTNKDGFITLEELRAAMQKRRDQTQTKGAAGAGTGTATGASTQGKGNMDDVDAIPK